MPTRILHITLRSDIGGGPKHVYDLAHSQNQDKSLQVFIASPIQPPFGQKFKDIAVNHLELPFRSFSATSFAKLLLFCRKNRIKLIHSHGRGAGIYSRLMKFFGYKIVHTYHGIHKAPSLTGNLKFLIDKLLLRLTDQVIYVSDDEQQTAKNYGIHTNSKSNVVNNGVLITHRTSIKPITNTIGTLARLSHPKGLDVLIDYFSILFKSNKDQNLKLLIAGSGEDLTKIKEQITKLNMDNNILLVGEKENPKDFLESLDIYVSCSRHEGLPLAVLEAMTLQIPCVLSDVTGHNVFIKNDAALGIKSSYDFNNHINNLFGDEELKSRLVSKAFNYVSVKHSHYDQVRQTHEIYRKLT